jgi:hypothetical protein
VDVDEITPPTDTLPAVSILKFGVAIDRFVPSNLRYFVALPTVIEVDDTAPAAVTKNGAVARLANVDPAQKAISVPAAGLFNPAAFAPAPIVKLAVLAAPLVRAKFGAAIEFPVSVNAATDPPVAFRADVVIVPVIVAFEAVNAPLAVTLKLAVARLANVDPDQNVISLADAALFNPPLLAPVPTLMFATFAAPEFMPRLVALIEFVPIVKAPIVLEVCPKLYPVPVIVPPEPTVIFPFTVRLLNVPFVRYAVPRTTILLNSAFPSALN